jgi:hypothetical protein
MGQIEVIEKLNRELKKNIKDECQIIYILSRVRKILEINDQKGKYKLLNLYCNWVLHNKLDRKNTTVLLADLFEQDIDCQKGGKENAIRIKSNHSNFFKLSSLKQELGNFFKDHNLSFDLSNKNWLIFVRLLLEIIKDCPIIFSSNKLRQLELVKNNFGDFCYKFSINGSKYKPIIKLKFT